MKTTILRAWIFLFAAAALGCSAAAGGKDGGMEQPADGNAGGTGTGGAGAGGAGGGASGGGGDASNGDTSGGRDGVDAYEAAPAPCPEPPAGTPAAAVQAWKLENAIRQAAGVPCANLVTALDTAATKHCAYFVANSGMCVANPHVKVSGCAMYVGAQYSDREKAAGYGGNPFLETMAFSGNPAVAIQMWVDSVYHRVPIVSPWARELGYGSAGACDTMDFGRGPAPPADIVAVYPYANQTGVPTSYDGRHEGPIPPAPSSGWPSGYPISVFAHGAVYSTHTLMVDGTTQPVAHTWLTNDQLLMTLDTVVMYADRPLQSRTKYQVHVVGKRGTASIDVAWSFTTK